MDCLPQWPKKPDEIHSRLDKILKSTREQFDIIAALPDSELCYDKVIRPICVPPNYKTSPEVTEAKFLQHVSQDKEIRNAAQNAGTELKKLRVECRMRADVYDKVVKYSQTAEAKSLPPEKRHFLDRVILMFKKSGLGLSEEKSAELKRLLAEDGELCAAYGETLANDQTVLMFDPTELKGMEDSFISERTDKETGKVKITLKYPDIIPISSHCCISETRKKVMFARSRDAFHGNLELVWKAARIRQKCAEILGFESYADFITSQRMVGSGQSAIDFLTELQKKLHKPAKAELDRLIKLKEAHYKEMNISKDFDDKLNPWDFGFYNELLLNREYGVDDKIIKQYFPLNHVIEQTLLIYQELLSLRFEQRADFDSWHPDAHLYAVFDKGTDQLMGFFFLDLHPRDGKYTHAAIFGLLKNKAPQVSLTCMLANLPTPQSDGTPPLLPHNDVVTFFHEFGHIMHDVCAEGDGNLTHLAKCPRDFVEAPSQMLENWCWQPEILNRLSCHHKDKSKLPQELLDKLIAAKNVNVALSTLRQISSSLLDLKIHMKPPSSVEEMRSIEDELRINVSLFENPKDCSMLRHFGHIMSQYQAAYYGYLWAEVISADMFYHRFKPEGILNPQTGMDYRKKVLAPGGIGKIMDHLITFLGREPQPEHFLRDRGLL